MTQFPRFLKLASRCKISLVTRSSQLFLTFFVTKFRWSSSNSHEKLIFRFTLLAVNNPIGAYGIDDWLYVHSLKSRTKMNSTLNLFFLHLDFFLSSTTFLRGVSTFSSVFHYVFHFYLLISFNSSCCWDFCGCYGLIRGENSENIFAEIERLTRELVIDCLMINNRTSDSRNNSAFSHSKAIEWLCLKL